MYFEHFGLHINPFGMSPRLDFLFRSTAFEESMAHLVYGIDNSEAIIMITGPVGSGKTMSLQWFLANLSQNYLTALVTNTQITTVGLLKLILEDLDVKLQPGWDKSDLLIAFKEYLIAAGQVGKRVVVVVDEAQNLSAEVLEEVRLLTNLGQGVEQPVQLILTGQPELKTMVNSPELAQLRQRIRVHCEMPTLDFEEMVGYINHRMAVAGCQRHVFDRPALKRLFEVSGGIPRLVNTHAGDALLSAFVAQRTTVGLQDVEYGVKVVQTRAEQERLASKTIVETPPPTEPETAGPAEPEGAALHFDPVVTPPLAEPTETLRPSEPEEASTSAKLEEILRPFEPKEAPRPVDSVTAAPAVKPVETPRWESRRPADLVETPRPAEPVETPRPAKPVEAPRPAKPVATPRPAEPVEAPRPAKPVETAPPAKPVATPRPAKPVETAPPAKPVATPRPAKPVETAPPPQPIFTPLDDGEKKVARKWEPRRDSARSKTKISRRFWYVAAMLVVVASVVGYAVLRGDRPAPAVTATDSEAANAQAIADSVDVVDLPATEIPPETESGENVVEVRVAASTEPTPEPASSVYYAHVASFREDDRAQAYLERLKDRSVSGVVEKNDSRGTAWYRVYIGPFAVEETAESTIQNLIAAGEIQFGRMEERTIE